MSEEEEQAAAYVFPPTRNLILPITVDTTSRAYDIGGFVWYRNQDTPGRGKIFLRMRAQTADVYYHFADVSTGAVVAAAAIAAGGTLAAGATYGDVIPAGTFQDVYVDLYAQRYLHIIGTAAAVLRISRTSNVPGALR